MCLLSNLHVLPCVKKWILNLTQPQKASSRGEACPSYRKRPQIPFTVDVGHPPPPHHTDTHTRARHLEHANLIRGSNIGKYHVKKLILGQTQPQKQAHKVGIVQAKQKDHPSLLSPMWDSSYLKSRVIPHESFFVTGA